MVRVHAGESSFKSAILVHAEVPFKKGHLIHDVTLLVFVRTDPAGGEEVRVIHIPVEHGRAYVQQLYQLRGGEVVIPHGLLLSFRCPWLSWPFSSGLPHAPSIP